MQYATSLCWLIVLAAVIVQAVPLKRGGERADENPDEAGAHARSKRQLDYMFGNYLDDTNDYYDYPMEWDNSDCVTFTEWATNIHAPAGPLCPVDYNLPT